MIRDSNCSVVEWLCSPLVYREDAGFVSDALQLLKSHVSTKALCHHLVNKARRHIREHLGEDRPTVALKKYFFVLQPLLTVCWTRAHGLESAFPPLGLEELVEQVSLTDAAVLESIQGLVAQKRQGALAHGAKIAVLDNWIDRELEATSTWLKSLLPNRNCPFHDFNAVFVKFATSFRIS